MLAWSESSGFLVGNRLMWRSGVKVSRLCYMIVYQTINSIGLEVEQLLMILERWIPRQTMESMESFNTRIFEIIIYSGELQ